MPQDDKFGAAVTIDDGEDKFGAPQTIDTAAPTAPISFPSATMGRGEGETARVLDAGVNSKFPFVHPLDAMSVVASPWQRPTEVVNNAKQMSGILGTMGLLDTGASLTEAAPKAMSSFGEFIDNPGATFSRLLRDPSGKITVTPTAIAERFVPQRPEILEAQHEQQMGSAIEAANKARQKEIVAQERLRTQHAQSLQNRARLEEQQGIRDVAARTVPAPPVRWPAEQPSAAAPKVAPPPVRWRPESTPAMGGESGIGSSSLEREMQTLSDPSRIITPDQFDRLKSVMGNDAYPRAGESQFDYRKRLTGGWKAARARTETQ